MSFTFSTVDRFIAGTVGVPGERQFFLQIRSGTRLICASLEKAQVSTLAERLKIMTQQILKQNPLQFVAQKTIDDQPLEQPIENDFDIGAISISWNEENAKICVELFSRQDFIANEIEEENAELTFNLDIGQVQSFVQRALQLVNAGRLPCPFCAIPIDPHGHLCPRANGYRR